MAEYCRNKLIIVIMIMILINTCTVHWQMDLNSYLLFILFVGIILLLQQLIIILRWFYWFCRSRESVNAHYV